jgi:hypothetical protein
MTLTVTQSTFRNMDGLCDGLIAAGRTPSTGSEIRIVIE